MLETFKMPDAYLHFYCKKPFLEQLKKKDHSFCFALLMSNRVACDMSLNSFLQTQHTLCSRYIKTTPKITFNLYTGDLNSFLFVSEHSISHRGGFNIFTTFGTKTLVHFL